MKVVNITGMRCASCVNRIEKALNGIEGVTAATVNLVTKKAFVDGQVSIDLIADTIEGLGFGVVKEPEPVRATKETVLKHDPEKANSQTKAENDEFLSSKRKVVISVALAIPLLFINMFSIQFDFAPLAQFLLATLVVFGVGFDFTRIAVAQAKRLEFGMDALIAMGSGAAYLYSVINLFAGKQNELYFETSAMIIALILFGRHLESKAKDRAGDAIKKLIELRPEKARITKEGREIEIPLTEVVAGNEIVIRPGETAPVDGKVLQGKTTVDESMITGESMPVIKKKDDDVFAGSINHNGSIRIAAKHSGAESVISKIIETVERAQSSKAPVQRLADRVAGVFVPIVIGIAAVTLTAWLLTGHCFSESLSPAIAVLVIACPCALGLAVPTAVAVSSGRAAKAGVLIKDATSLENALKIETLMFDKTGTITKGVPVITGIYSVGNMTKGKILEIAASCERYSEHPLGKAIVELANKEDAQLGDAEDFKSSPGEGISAKYNGAVVCLGNSAFMRKNCVDTKVCEAKVNDFKSGGETVFYMAIDGKAEALISMSDTLRDTTMPAIKRLKSMGIAPIMLTGDDEKTAAIIAAKAGIESFKAGLSPIDKANEIKLVKIRGKIAGMVGDGINDAPALAEADVGFAMGTGTDIAMDAAQITLVKGDISKVAGTINLSKMSAKIIRQNLIWAFGYNLAALPIAALGMLDPMIAAAAMALSSVSVVSNSLRLKNCKFE